MRKLKTWYVCITGWSRHKRIISVTIEWNGLKDNTKPLFCWKGCCFDTGGYSLKPVKFMEDMTYDMAGSATVVGLMKSLALEKKN